MGNRQWLSCDHGVEGGRDRCGPRSETFGRPKSVVYTEVEGDQPSLLIGLNSWAETLGLEVLAAGKSSEYDFVLEEDDTLCWR